MKKAVLFLVLAAMLVGSVPVLADGMFYWTESIPPEIPYQRALLMFDGGYETLIVQSKYRMSSSATEAFGWVVPVPSVPELASVEPDYAEMLFWELAQASQPKVTEVSDWLWGLFMLICLFIAPAAGILLLLLWAVSFFTPRLQFVWRRRWVVFGTSILLLVISTLGWFLSVVSVSLSAREGGTVDVIWEDQVGIYDVQVVKAGEAGDLIGWLNDNQFQFDEGNTQVFDDYLRRGWCFVVARVDPARSTEQVLATQEGLVAPLILRFETVAPVYPLALTAMAGYDTQVLLYVLGQHKWQNDGRLDLEYAGEARVGELDAVCREAGPEMAAACLDDAVLPYLCKFKGTLTPAQMVEDLVLAPAEDDEPYRKHIVKW